MSEGPAGEPRSPAGPYFFAGQLWQALLRPRMRRLLALACAVFAGAGCLLGAGAQAEPTYRTAPPTPLPGQHPYSAGVRLIRGGRARVVRVEYLLYAPRGYGRSRARGWPLVVFLHGGGERGADPGQLTAQPLPRTLARTTRFPALVLSPQLPLRFTFWSQLIEPVDALVRRLEARYRIDRRRVYLTGLSTGGFGTWEYGLRHPHRFAALVPIAGGYPGVAGAPAGMCALRRVPIWAFHGAADTTVPPYQEEALVRALRRCGSKVVRLTLLPGVDHSDSWLRAYSDPALWRWLFSQRLP